MDSTQFILASGIYPIHDDVLASGQCFSTAEVMILNHNQRLLEENCRARKLVSTYFKPNTNDTTTYNLLEVVNSGTFIRCWGPFESREGYHIEGQFSYGCDGAAKYPDVDFWFLIEPNLPMPLINITSWSGFIATYSGITNKHAWKCHLDTTDGVEVSVMSGIYLDPNGINMLDSSYWISLWGKAENDPTYNVAYVRLNTLDLWEEPYHF
jgi:hypothetical protein